MKYNQIIPKDGIAGLKENWKKDLLSGFFVFLIALPLSLGIAMASDMPPMAGIVAAVVGGMVVSILAGSHVTINGPAAGLIVVMLGAVETLGEGEALAGYQFTLAAIVLAGVFIFLLGIFKAGAIGDFFPMPVVHGLLASIGIIIISKQIHIMLGVNPQATTPIPLLSEIPQSLIDMNPKIAFIGFISLCFLIILNSPIIKRIRIMKIFPAPMIVVLISIGLGYVFNLEEEHSYFFLDKQAYFISPQFLVTLPDNIFESIAFPDFGKIGTYKFWMVVITITLVQSLETVMIAKAVEQLDSYKRRVNFDKDLRAMGIGNIISGSIGGLPMIAEIVRSSANISNGAKTRWANFFHGVFMLVFVIFFPQLIHRIPLAALAAMLVFTGYRLASPQEFGLLYRVGLIQFSIFLITIVITLATDLLIGVFSGIVVKTIFQLYYGAPIRSLFQPSLSIKHDDADTYRISIAQSITFTNYLSFKRFLKRIPNNKHIILDFSGAEFVDYTVMEHLHILQSEYKEYGGKLELVGLDNLTPLSMHPLSVRVANVHVKTKTAQLNERQKRIATIAQQNGYIFNPQKVLFDSKLKNLPFFLSKQLKYEDNILYKNISDTHIQLSDIHAKEGDQIGLRIYNFTALLITDTPVRLPLFSLQKEHFTDKVLSKAGFKDINFEEHEQFSKMFLLQGKNEAQIRAFFDKPLMDLMVNYPKYHVESDGNSILIHKEIKFLDSQELEELIGLGEKWRFYITQRNIQEMPTFK
jgi:MFS superfamily sulfate permease-like transporter